MSDTALGRTIMALAIMGIVFGAATLGYVVPQHIKAMQEDQQ